MKITDADFQQLTINSTNWNETQNAWRKQTGRFEDIDFRVQDSVEVDYSFLRAYWAERYADVLFIRAFLESLGYAYRVYFDTADNTYTVTTNYGGSL